MWVRRADLACKGVFLRRECLQELIQQGKLVAQFVEFCFDSGIGQCLGAQLLMRQHLSTPSFACAQAQILWAN
jgi:hypothetical protein